MTKYSFNTLLKAEKKRINFLNRGRAVKILLMALVRFGENFVWIPVPAYKMNDYYFTDPKSEIGVVRFTLPDREYVEEIRGGGYSGMVFMVIPNRDMYYFIKVNKHDIKESIVKLKVKDKDGNEKFIEVPLKEVMKPTLKIKKGFFEQSAEISGYKMILVQTLTDLEKEKQAKMTFLEKWGPTLTNIFVIIAVGVVAYLLVGRIEEATGKFVQASNNFVQSLAHKIAPNLTNVNTTAGGNW